MGKGYNNYMCKKPFHPGSKANIKRAWMAEQKQENEKKKQEEMRLQYEKEQDLYTNKAMVSTESKEKLALNFMYEAPPGAKRERQKEDDEPEYKFEWQRKFNAPREDFAKDNKDIRDQPFGIPVRNVRCIKCHQWGHLNTDRECPLFNQASKNSASGSGIDPLDLMKLMRADGLALKKEVLGHHFDMAKPNQQLISSDEEEDAEMEFLKTLSTKQKKKLLRKLDKLAEKQASEDKKKSKKKKKKHHRSSSSDSDSAKPAKSKHKKSKNKRKHRRHSDSLSDSSSKKRKATSDHTEHQNHKRHKKTHRSSDSSD